MPTRYNPIVRSPLLRKGGVHQRPRSGERQRDDHTLREELEQWEEQRKQQEEGPETAPFFVRVIQASITGTRWGPATC